jgi:archaellum component FlaG (FlaF/FlaG flagellin family)
MSLMNMLFTGNEARLYSDLRVTGTVSGMTAANAPAALSIQPSGQATTIGGDLTVNGNVQYNPINQLTVGGLGIQKTLPLNALLHVVQPTASTGDIVRVDDETNDTTPFIIKDDGKTGIGLADPNNKLAVYGDIAMGVYTGKTTSRSAGYLNWYSGGFPGELSSAVAAIEGRDDYDGTFNGSLRFYTQASAVNTEKMRITYDGKVGISKTNPTAILHVNHTGTDDIVRVDDENNDTTPFIIKNDGKTGIGLAAPGATLHVNHTGSDDILRVDDEVVTDSTPFIIKNDGKTGVGLADPNNKFTVYGDIAMGAYTGKTTSRSAGYLNWYSGSPGGELSSAVAAIEGRDDYDGGFHGSLRFYTQFNAVNTEKMRITRDGNVGIGIVTPSTRVHTDGVVLAKSSCASFGNTDKGRVKSIKWNAGGMSLVGDHFTTLGSGNANVIGASTSTTTTELITLCSGGWTHANKRTSGEIQLTALNQAFVAGWYDEVPAGTNDIFMLCLNVEFDDTFSLTVNNHTISATSTLQATDRYYVIPLGSRVLDFKVIGINTNGTNGRVKVNYWIPHALSS